MGDFAARARRLCKIVYKFTLVIFALMPGTALAGDCLTPRTRQFNVYNGMFYRGQPDLSGAGLQPIHIIDRDIWMDEAKRTKGDSAKFNRAVAKLPDDNAPIVLDLESIPMSRTSSSIASGISEISRITNGIRREAPKRSIGLYAIYPRSEYWRAINSLQHGGISALRTDNDRIAKLDDVVDAIYPSLYTFYDDRAGWVRQAKTLVCEARRLSRKPVYAFIWPEYHSSAAKKGQWLPVDYWQLQLDTLHQIADGIVIWGGFDLYANKSRQWDAHAPWWLAVRRRMETWRRR